jgi:hypothetical protein
VGWGGDGDGDREIGDHGDRTVRTGSDISGVAWATIEHATDWMLRI